MVSNSRYWVKYDTQKIRIQNKEVHKLCIIASVPAGAQVTEAQLEEMWNRNSDGGGIAYFDNGKIVTEKSMDKKQFIARVLEIQGKYGNRDMLVHMRIATHGSVCLDNNHPFQVNKNTVMAHNGILPNAFIPPAKSDLSDTRFFIEYFMKHVPVSQLDDPYFCDMVDGMINQGYGNKLVFMTSAPTKYDTYIIGDYHGTWDKGIWFSNDSYKSRKWLGVNHGNGGLTRVGSTMVSDNCEIVGIDDEFDEVEPDQVNDWLVWHADIWREFQEVGVLDMEELCNEFKVKMTWDGLVCTECGEKVEGVYSRYCEIDCESVSPVLDWCYANLNMDDADIDQMLYEESLYRGKRAPVEQTKLFDNKEGVYKNSKKSKTKKTNKSTKSKKKANK